MKKEMQGQMSFSDLSKIYRTECLIVKGAPCNIFYAHDVAIDIGEDCKYGCCNACKAKRLCGASCNNCDRTK